MSENAYRIAVLTKYVPDTQFEQKLDDTLRVDRSESVMSELDEYAVEAAMQIVEAEDTDAANSAVIAFTLGAADASKGLRRALQMGHTKAYTFSTMLSQGLMLWRPHAS